MPRRARVYAVYKYPDSAAPRTGAWMLRKIVICAWQIFEGAEGTIVSGLQKLPQIFDKSKYGKLFREKFHRIPLRDYWLV